MLDLSPDRPLAIPKDAATVILVREGVRGGVEVFCVERHKDSPFMGGAIVFPGGKIDGSDLLAEWTPLTTPIELPTGRGTTAFAASEAHFRSLAIAAARETLEEAAALHVSGGHVIHDELVALRRDLEQSPGALRAFLERRGQRLDLGALHPFARWVTPEAESRRFDARFFLAVVPEGQQGAHDEREMVASFWATPADVLGRFDRGDVQLMPPTHRTLLWLSACSSVGSALARAGTACLDPICPRLARHVDDQGETIALVLPGDPEHDVREARVSGPSRYILRGDRWRAGDPPR